MPPLGSNATQLIAIVTVGTIVVVLLLVSRATMMAPPPAVTWTHPPAPSLTTEAPATIPGRIIGPPYVANTDAPSPPRETLPPCSLRGVDFPTADTPLVKLSRPQGPTPAPRNPCADPDQQFGYGWRFVEYQPSALEGNWTRMIADVEKRDGVCELWRRHFSKEGVQFMATLHMYQAAVAVSTDAVCPLDVAIRQLEPAQFDHALYSRFMYSYDCIHPPCGYLPVDAPSIGTLRYSYIEPLAAILRHPAMCESGPHVTRFDTTYILFDRWATTALNPNRKKSIYLDGGATPWTDYQHWFFGKYVESCAPFTDMYGWEIRPMNATEVWAAVPGPLRPRYRWYNVAMKTDPDSWDNPNNVILSEASTEDVVVLKLDFHMPKIENVLLQQILDNPSLAARIDELFVEHHVDVEVMRGYWASAGTGLYLSDSMKLFTALRQRGIRAHSWI